MKNYRNFSPVVIRFFFMVEIRIKHPSFYDKVLYSVKKVKLSQPISNGNRTECSPIRSVIIRVITKSADWAAGVRFVYHEYDYRPNWTTQSPITITDWL